ARAAAPARVRAFWRARVAFEETHGAAVLRRRVVERRTDGDGVPVDRDRRAEEIPCLGRGLAEGHPAREASALGEVDDRPGVAGAEPRGTDQALVVRRSHRDPELI